MANNTSTLQDAKKAAKGMTKTAKGAKSIGKMSAAIASGNWAGAIKEFFKNPGGILTAFFAPILATIILIVYILGTLVGTVWGIITDNVPKSAVDDYLYMENAVNVNSFVPAYEYVSKQALFEVCTKVKGLDLGNFDEVSEKIIFKDVDSLQKWLGKGFQQMSKYADNGNIYPDYDKVRNAVQAVFALMQDDSNGFEEIYDNSTADYTAWQKTVSIFDFNNTVFNEYGTALYYPFTDESPLNAREKAQYNITYNNKKFKQDGISVAMLQTIFNLKYDYEKTVEVNAYTSDESGKRIYTNSDTQQIVSCLESAEVLIKLKSANYEKMGMYLGLMIDAYDSLGDDAYYLDADIMNRANSACHYFKDKKAAEGSKYYDDVRKDFEGEMDEGSISSPVVERMENIKEDKLEEFIEFMSKPEVYEKLLTYTVSAPQVKDCSIPIDFYLPSYNTGTDTNPNNDGLIIENIVKQINIEISVDFCDYDTLGEIFGLFTINENGERDNINVDLINYILSNVSDDESAPEIDEDDEEAKAEAEEALKKELEESLKVVNGIPNNAFLWPLGHVDEVDSKIVITSKYGSRKDPIDGVNKFHDGLDIGAPEGTLIAASLPGKVITVGYNNSLGNHVVTESNIMVGDVAKTYRITYAHMKQVAVFEGAKITRSSNVVGYVGNTGKSTGSHLHFEIQEKQEDGTFASINPETLLGEKTNYILRGEVGAFNNTIEAFFEECKDAGAATASVLTDAGYLKSSTYWQYKQNCFNVMFCSNVSDDSKLPFFVDVENIARNSDGTLKIVEFDSASFTKEGWALGDATLKAEEAAQKLNKRFYAVYCHPSTIVTLPFSAYRTDLDGNKISYLELKNWWYGNNVDESEGGYNVVISHLPSVFPPDENEKEKYDKWVKDNENALTTECWNKNNFDELKEFSYLSYTFSNNSYVFDVCNVQISAPNANGEAQFIHGDRYKQNYGGNYLHYSAMKGLDKYETVAEVLERNETISGYQLNPDGKHPVILGTTLIEDLYPTNKPSYDINNPDTYPFFVVSVSLAPAIQSENVEYRGLSIYDVFDLDVIEEKTYIDESTSHCWPVIQSYEHSSFVTSKVDEGTIVAMDLTQQYIVYQNKIGDYRRITNIIPNAELEIGASFSVDSTILGRSPDGLISQISRGQWDSKNGYKEIEPLNAGLYLKTTTNVALRSDAALNEDSYGTYLKVVSMMDGEVVDVVSNSPGRSDGSITVYSTEQDLYFEYKDISVSKFIKKGDKVARGGRIGETYLYTNGVPNTVKFSVYGMVEINGELEKVYYNPTQMFPKLNKVESSARRIIIKNPSANTNTEELETLSGFILHKEKTKQLSYFIYPYNSMEDKVVWASSDESIIKVDQTGLVTSTGKAGVATVSCDFIETDDDGVAGVGAQCVIQVPEVVTNINVKYGINGGAKQDIDPSNEYIDAIMVDGKATIDFDAVNDTENAFQGVKWTVTDMNGNATDKVTIDAGTGVITSTVPNTSTDYYNVKVESTSAANAASGNAYGHYTVKVKFVQPITSIEVNQNYNLIELYKNNQYVSETIKEGVHFTVQPANATYKDVRFTLETDIAKLVDCKRSNGSFNKDNTGVSVTIKPDEKKHGTAKLKIEPEHGNGSVKAAYINVSSSYIIDDSFELMFKNGVGEYEKDNKHGNMPIVYCLTYSGTDAEPEPEAIFNVHNFLTIKYKDEIINPQILDVEIGVDGLVRPDNGVAGHTFNMGPNWFWGDLDTRKYTCSYTIANQNGTFATKYFVLVAVRPLSIVCGNMEGTGNYAHFATHSALNGGSSTLNGRSIGICVYNGGYAQNSDLIELEYIVEESKIESKSQTGFGGQFAHSGPDFIFKEGVKTVPVKVVLKAKKTGEVLQTWTHTFNIAN